MNPYILQGLAFAGPIMAGVTGMLANNWVSNYRDDKHFYETRFLDIDGDPDSADKGYFKDDSGKLIPIIVEKYSFGYCKKSRYVEGFEITEDGQYGLPFKESLKDFRSKEIRRQKFQLSTAQKDIVQGLLKDDLQSTPVAVLQRRLSVVEKCQREQMQIILHDLNTVFKEQKELLALDQKFSDWEKKRPTEMGKLKVRTAKLEKKVLEIEASLTAP